MTAPLDGLLVADFSRVLAGPYATATLADLGAEVVKVERPGLGDDTRHWGPPWTATSSSYFESVNRSKRSVELDLKDPADLALARELAGRADVLVENHRSGALDRLGLGYAEVSRDNPGIVYCSVTGFGSGAGAEVPGYDFLVQAVGGLMSITGDPHGEPTKVGVALVDVLTGKDAVVGVLAALAERARTGQGQHVEVNLLSSLLGALANQAGAYLATGSSPTRMGNRHPSIAPYETLRCRDRSVALACGNDGQFRRLAEAVGVPHLADDPRFARNPDRVAHRDALVEALEDALGEDDADSWVKRIGDTGVPVGVVGDIGSAIALAESLDLGPTVDVGPGHPRQVRHPATYSRSTTRPMGAPPALGQHNDEIRAWLTRPAGSRPEAAGRTTEGTEPSTRHTEGDAP
ncbi:formyl-CoA transferase [Pedococcus cremeus]|uniref:Formyl-CoA transferase n=1 Tax=Pedococcus cremeus TaxID=587636 RepID=A0A1H9XUB6_9MICO|nr:CoA transferase [Pedococcus cremeus]SES49758.1 formyl-CoA transferase [Pedococcus cremeus]